MTPIELLQKELKSLERAKDKSIASYNKDEISKELHITHLKNLNPKIKLYTKAINKLIT